MANELTWANLETNAGIAHALSGDIHADLYDPTDLRGLCVRIPFLGGMGSETTKTPRFSPAHTFTAATNELTGGGSNEDIGDSNFQISVARRYMRWQLSDLWMMVAPNGSLDLDLLKQIIVEGTGLTFTDMLCALFPSLSTDAGSATAQASVDMMLDGQYGLNNSRAPAPYSLVWSPHGFNKFQASLTTYGGALQFQAATADMIAAKGPGFKGRVGNVDVYDSDSVTLDGGSTYRRGAIFARGAYKYQEAPVQALNGILPAEQRSIVDGIVRIVTSWDADNGVALVVGDYYPGVSEAEDARGRLMSHLAS